MLQFCALPVSGLMLVAKRKRSEKTPTQNKDNGEDSSRRSDRLDQMLIWGSCYLVSSLHKVLKISFGVR